MISEDITLKDNGRRGSNCLLLPYCWWQLAATIRVSTVKKFQPIIIFSKLVFLDHMNYESKADLHYPTIPIFSSFFHDFLKISPMSTHFYNMAINTYTKTCLPLNKSSFGNDSYIIS